MQDLRAELTETVAMMDTALRKYKERAKEYSEAEKAYRIALHSEIMILKDQKFAATLISDLARGNKEIAELKRARDYSQALLKSAYEAINVNKIKVKLIEEQIKREWK